MIVDLELAKKHLNIYHDDEDDLIELYISAAEGAVTMYLDGFPFSNYEVGELPVQIKQAVLILLGEFYLNREAEQGGAINQQFGYGYLPRPVVALLWPFKKVNV